MPLEKWYGSRIGFGVNNSTKANILRIEINRFNRPAKTTFKKDRVYFCWVEELNVRDGASTKGEVITTIKEGAPVKFLGETGNTEVKATFRGIYSPDFYYKVELVDGTKGWVHGGALNEIDTAKPLDFSSYRDGPITTKTNEHSLNSSKDFYMIAVYAEKEEHRIKQKTKELRDKGFDAKYLWIPDYKSLSGAQMFSAYIGPFSTQEACKNQLSKVKMIFPEAYGLLASKTSTQRKTVN